jgi:hypothetical protein
MWLYNKEGLKEFNYDLWRYMVNEHKIDVVTLDRMRYVIRDVVISGLMAITSVRVFLPHEAAAKGISVTGWETFDEHPELILYEGYMNQDNKAFLVKK